MNIFFKLEGIYFKSKYFRVLDSKIKTQIWFRFYFHWSINTTSLTYNTFVSMCGETVLIHEVYVREDKIKAQIYYFFWQKNVTFQ